MERKEQEHMSKRTGQEYTGVHQGTQSRKLVNKYTKWRFPIEEYLCVCVCVCIKQITNKDLL